ncbi:hypothetical protein ACJX0J_037523, partial [Zea mays]
EIDEIHHYLYAQMHGWMDGVDDAMSYRYNFHAICAMITLDILMSFDFYQNNINKLKRANHSKISIIFIVCLNGFERKIRMEDGVYEDYNWIFMNTICIIKGVRNMNDKGTSDETISQ